MVTTFDTYFVEDFHIMQSFEVEISVTLSPSYDAMIVLELENDVYIEQEKSVEVEL